MQNFTFNIPTVVHFGKGQISKLGEEIASRPLALWEAE